MKIQSITRMLALSLGSLLLAGPIPTGLSQDQPRTLTAQEKLADRSPLTIQDDSDSALLDMGQEFARQVAKELGLDVSEIVAGGLVTDPTTGRTFFNFKMRDKADQVSTLVLDRRGNLVSTDSTWEVAATEDKLHPDLRQALDAADDRELLRVMLWCRTPEDLPLPARAEAQDPNTEAQLRMQHPRFELPDAKATPAPVLAAQEALAMARALVVAQDLTAMGIASQMGPDGPFLSAWMSKTQILAIATHPDVLQCYLEDINAPSMATSRNVIGASAVNNRGITGNGVRVGVIEVGGRVNLSNPWLFGTQRVTSTCLADHAAMVGGVIGSRHATERGIAPNANLYFAGSCSGLDNELRAATAAAIGWGARVINNSWNTSDGNGGSHPSRVPNGTARYLDQLTGTRFVTIVHSAGNSGGRTNNVVNPATAFNLITVGAFDDRGTVSNWDDSMASFSGYLNPSSSRNDRVKPEVVAPGVNITSLQNSSNWLRTGSGTSYAAPAVAGIASLMLERRQSLNNWPESVKAIIMATAWENLEGSARLSTFDGAGGVKADRADDLTQGIRGGWVGRPYTQAAAANLNVQQIRLTAGRRARIVLCWNQDTNFSNYANQPAVDLDLQILNTNGSVVAGSYSYDNTYEIVDFVPTSTGVHTIRVNKFRTSGSVNGIGVAWYQP